MKAFSALFALASVLGASALPAIKRDSGPTDTQVLQYALTLENLENNFYAGALSNFSYSDFESEGFPDWVRGRLSQIGSHESAHVALLSGALGSSAVQNCSYNFPYTDVRSFISLATLIENVGVSAYAGAAQYIQNKEYLTVAASILSTESRHQAWENSAALNGAAWSGPFDTPLGLDMVYTIASAFITGCPDSNAMLPVEAFPALTVSGMVGENAQFTFDDPHNATNYAIFYSGLGTAACQLDENDMAMIPSDLQGISYVVISTCGNATEVMPSNIVAGPAILNFPFSAYVADPAFMG